jgi:hypothetical protein
LTLDEIQLILEGDAYKQELDLLPIRLLGYWIIKGNGGKISKPEKLLPLPIIDGKADKMKDLLQMAKDYHNGNRKN